LPTSAARIVSIEEWQRTSRYPSSCSLHRVSAIADEFFVTSRLLKMASSWKRLP
jgi:hypothetical protein